MSEFLESLNPQARTAWLNHLARRVEDPLGSGKDPNTGYIHKMPPHPVDPSEIIMKDGTIELYGPEDDKPGLRPIAVAEKNPYFAAHVEVMGTRVYNGFAEQSPALPWFPWYVGCKIFRSRSNPEAVWPLAGNLEGIAFAITILHVFWSWQAGYDIMNVKTDFCHHEDKHDPRSQETMYFFRRQTALVESAFLRIKEDPSEDPPADPPVDPIEPPIDLSTSDEEKAVYNGENAPLDRYPWAVALGGQNFPGDFLYERAEDQIPLTSCSGSLIRPDWVLTAAHCVKLLLKTYWVTAGTNCRPELGGIKHGQVRKVARVYPHSFWNAAAEPQLLSYLFASYVNNLLDLSMLIPVRLHVRLHFENDLALLRLERPFNPMPGKVETIRLASDSLVIRPNYDHSMPIRLAGWGFTGNQPPAAQNAIYLQELTANTTLSDEGAYRDARPDRHNLTQVPEHVWRKLKYHHNFKCLPGARLGCVYLGDYELGPPYGTYAQITNGDSGSGVVWDPTLDRSRSSSSSNETDHAPQLVGVLSAGYDDYKRGSERTSFVGFCHMFLFPWTHSHTDRMEAVMDHFDHDHGEELTNLVHEVEGEDEAEDEDQLNRETSPSLVSEDEAVGNEVDNDSGPGSDSDFSFGLSGSSASGPGSDLSSGSSSGPDSDPDLGPEPELGQGTPKRQRRD